MLICWKTNSDMQRADLVQRQSMLGEDAFGYASSHDHNGMVPPNMRRDSSAAWSEADSEVLLVDQKDRDEPSRFASRWRG